MFYDIKNTIFFRVTKTIFLFLKFKFAFSFKVEYVVLNFILIKSGYKIMVFYF